MIHYCPKPSPSQPPGEEPPGEEESKEYLKRKREVLSDGEEQDEELEEEPEKKLEVGEDCPNQPPQGLEGEAEEVEEDEDSSYASAPSVHLEEQCVIGMTPGDSMTYREVMAELSKMALQKYNKYLNANVEFEEILRATRSPCRGINYFITFRVKDLPVCFQALVNKFVYECLVVCCCKESDADGEGYDTRFHDYPE